MLPEETRHLQTALDEANILLIVPTKESELITTTIIKIKTLAMLDVIKGMRPGIDQGIDLKSIEINDREALNLLTLLFPQTTIETLRGVLEVVKQEIAMSIILAKRERLNTLFI